MTMRVTPKVNVKGEAGADLVAGTTYTVSDAFGAALVGSGRAVDTDGALTPPGSEPARVNTNPFTGGLVLAASGLGRSVLNTVVPPTRDIFGIEIAVSACVAMGGGTVVYEDADYTITADHTFVDNVSHIGVPAKLTFDGDVPDADFTLTGGTRFIQSPGVTGFKHNNVNKGVEETDIAEESCTGVKVYGITFIGGKRAVDTGAYLAMGMVFSEFDQLYGMDQTDDFAFNFVNFQHCQFGRIYTSTQLLAGSGIRLGAALSATLLPGNSTVSGELYTYCKNRKNRSIVIECYGPSGGVLNQMKVAGRLQGNRYGAAAPDSITMVFTSGLPDIGVANATHFDTLQVDMPVAFDTAVAGFSIRTVYYVRTRNTGNQTITLAETPYATASINASASTSGVARCGGYPSLEIVARAGCSINNSDFGLIDAEAFGNVCAVSLAKIKFCTAYLAEVMTSATGTALACRDVFAGLTCAGHPALTQDESSLFGQVQVTNLAGGPFAYTGGSFTLDASHSGRAYRYSSTSDITITVPNNLPKGFEFSITPTGATGIVTFVASSGGAIFSFGGKLRTAGQNATATLRNIGNRVFSLSGDLQV